MSEDRRQTQTGGREATGGHIPGDVALAVGDPQIPCPEGFVWRRLTDLARLETGHTPSRRVPEYWEGGTLPWIGVRDATSNHGRTIYATNEYITEKGEQNSSTRLLPVNTVCLSRTASVGFVVVMGTPMCTSQDFVNWVCGPELDHRYLKYILLAEKKAFLRFASGTTHQTVYFPEVKAFHVMVPNIIEQQAIADVLGALDDKIESNRRIWQTSLELISVARSHLTSSEIVSTTSLGQLVDFNVNTKKPGPNSESIVYVDIASVSPGSIEKRQVLHWGSAPSRARRGVGDGDVIFSMVRPGRRSFAAIFDPDPRMVVSTGFAVMTPRHCGTSFLLAVVLDTNFSDYCETVAQGSAYPAVSPESMARYEVEVPSVHVLASFESTYLPIIRRGDRAQSESLILSALRDSLLPELLSGRLRIADAQKVVEEAV